MTCLACTCSPQRPRPSRALSHSALGVTDRTVRRDWERARLLLNMVAMDAPHMLILDEPTNHLDIDSRRALLDALNDYEGAVILITHDRSLMELVADRLWLAADGTATATTTITCKRQLEKNYLVKKHRKG